MRTLLETNVHNIIYNNKGRKKLTSFAKKASSSGILSNLVKKTSSEKSIIFLKDEVTHGKICNRLGNKIISLCASDFIHQDLLLNRQSIKKVMYMYIYMSYIKL